MRISVPVATDWRGRAELCKAPAPMSVIYLVRHGQGSFGSADYDRLSELGREQSRLVGTHFAELGERIDAVYSGNLRRQRETAELIVAGLERDAASLPIAVDPAFDEYDGTLILQAYAGSLTSDELERAGWPDLHVDRKRFQWFLERAARAWVEDRVAAEGLLSWSGFRTRVVGALDAIMAREGRSKTVVVSTSGGVIGTIVAHLLGLTNHIGIELNWAVHNASITRVIYNDHRASLAMFNALPHLERAGRTELITYR